MQRGNVLTEAIYGPSLILVQTGLVESGPAMKKEGKQDLDQRDMHTQTHKTASPVKTRDGCDVVEITAEQSDQPVCLQQPGILLILMFTLNFRDSSLPRPHG